jgi:Flp pilus assembly protein TadG
MTSSERGQILPLFALLLIGLCAIAALAMDVTGAYAARQAYRTAADAASLAGAQDLVASGTRSLPTDPMKTSARDDALKSLLRDLGATGTGTGACSTATQVADCELTGTGFHVWITTPVTTCVSCDTARSIQVTVANPAFPVTFAHLLGVDHWNVASTAVAGTSIGQSYAIVALRPPNPSKSFECTPGCQNDIKLASNNTRVRVTNGDVGSNVNMLYEGLNAKLELDAGYSMYYYDPYNGPKWSTPADPPGKKLPGLIPDPNYPIPGEPAATVGEVAASACRTLVETKILSLSKYVDAAKALNVADSSGAITDWTKVHCYNPGRFDTELVDNNRELTVLLPGLYYFNQGLDIQSMLVGGFDPATSGVSLVFPRKEQFKQRSGAVILNAGSKFRDSTGSEPSTAPAMTNTSPSLKITIAVQRDDACKVIEPYPDPCNDTENLALSLAGGTAIYLGGVQYAPSDNSAISGSSDGQGYVGQVWAWTLTYSGGTKINQEGAGATNAGVLRLDGACAAGGVTCGGP